MRIGLGGRLVMSVAACAVVVSGAASASAAKPSVNVEVGIEAALPVGAAGVESINSVSCPWTGNCTAVGSYDDSASGGKGLLLTKTAGRWEPGAQAALPANAATNGPGPSLESVSCSSAGNCAAVGSYRDTTGNVEGLLLTETAGSWSAGVEASLPADAVSTNQDAQLASVSCASDGNCSAVGSYRVSDPADPVTTDIHVRGLLLSETAGTWGPAVEATPPANANAADPQAWLQSVSCASAGDCTAVGYYDEDLSHADGLLLTETSGSWSPGVEAALPSDADPALQSASVASVSCTSAGDCSAIGSYSRVGLPHTSAMLLTETAGSWAPPLEATWPADVTPDNISPSGSISCSSAGNCTALVGYIDTAPRDEGLLLTETDGSWATGIEAPLPDNARTPDPRATFSAVSCASAGNCTAVGDYGIVPNVYEGFLLKEASGSWSAFEVQPPANAAGTPKGILDAVSCAPAGDCSAGGWYEDGDNLQGLLTGGSPALVSLAVTRVGKGLGVVSSSPAGIHCGPTCLASFDSGSTLTLTATPRAGTRFDGWSGGGCFGTRSCKVSTGIGEQTVMAKFSLLPACLVPSVTGRTLDAARRLLELRHCTVGNVKRKASRKMGKGRVISQMPEPGTSLKHRARVNLVLSKGLRTP